MGLLFFLAFSLLIITTASHRDVPQSSCSFKFNEDLLHDSSAIHLSLHHPRSPCNPAPRPDLPFSDILLHDSSRARAFSSRLTHNATRHHVKKEHHDAAATSAASTPLTPGASVNVGNYITMIGLGTPSVPYVMVVDTGSSLSWLQCYPCKISCHDQVGAIFDPSASSSYRTVPCEAAECLALQSATLNTPGCTSSGVCIYEASYGDTSFSVGYLSKDTLSLNPGAAALSAFVYGCGQDNEGLFGKSAGLLGMAKNKLSLLYQLAPEFGSTFSYCLSTAASTGYLSFGSYNPAGYAFTPLAKNSLDDSLYFVHLAYITVAGKSLPVASSAYTSKPTIIDSGTVITRLPTEVYTALSTVVVKAMSSYAPAPAFSILDTCFKGSLKGMVTPEVALVFNGGAALSLSAKNLLLDVDSSTTCLAFAESGNVAIIGNHQQQTFRIVYDVGSSKLGFASGGCG